jgi:hypothetical protein
MARFSWERDDRGDAPNDTAWLAWLESRSYFNNLRLRPPRKNPQRNDSSPMKGAGPMSTATIERRHEDLLQAGLAGGRPIAISVDEFHIGSDLMLPQTPVRSFSARRRSLLTLIAVNLSSHQFDIGSQEVGRCRRSIKAQRIIPSLSASV